MHDAALIGFRRLTADDLPLLYRWINEDNMIKQVWTQGEGYSMEQLQAKYGPRIRGEEATDAYVILYGSTPVGYIQTYLWRNYPEYAADMNLTEEAASLDLFIGEADYRNRGLGRHLLTRFMREFVFADPTVASCIITPEVGNIAAIRAYERAGFSHLRTIDHPDEAGPVYLMRIARDQLPASPLRIEHLYSLDLANFFSILTGDEFYVQRHAEAYARWADRLSAQAKESVAAAVAINGSPMLGPTLCYVFSAIPGFESVPLTDALDRPATVEPYALSALGFTPDDWQTTSSWWQTLAPVARELEELGFRSYWENERLPLIHAAAQQNQKFLSSLRLDVGAAVSTMLGPQGPVANQPITLYLCSFAAPHGMKLFGKRFVSDVRYEPKDTLRIAIHEMFHPPFAFADVAEEAAALIGDPLFHDAFTTKDSKYGYPEADGFLEENIVEAMELHVSTNAGLIDDPIEYLLKHDEGSHKLSIVLLKYFADIPKAPDEPFGAYLKRLVPRMPLGHLQEIYNQQMNGRTHAG